MRGSLLLLLLSLSIVVPAWGQQGNAEEVYREAQRLYKEGSCDKALPLFESLRDQSPNARLYVARCYRENGRYPEAYEEMAVTRDEAGKLAKTEQRYAATRDAAQQELKKLREKVALIQLRPAAVYKDLEIEINGRLIGNADRLKKPIPVMPGAVRVHASAPDFDNATTELKVEADPKNPTDVAIILTPRPGYIAKVAREREQQEKQKKLNGRPRTRAAIPPPRMPPASRGCASIAGDRHQDWLLLTVLFAALLAVRRRGGVDARRFQPVHSKTTHGRPGTRRRDCGVATPSRAALGARQAGGRLGS